MFFSVFGRRGTTDFRVSCFSGASSGGVSTHHRFIRFSLQLGSMAPARKQPVARKVKKEESEDLSVHRIFGFQSLLVVSQAVSSGMAV
jgi:hypothetical protein